MSEGGRTVGRYEVIREIGRGGMAIVYLARQSDLDRYVALKELSTFHQSDATFTRRFVRESRVIASLSHPNIVTVYEYYEEGGAPYIAMEYVPRGSLRPHVKRLSVAQAAGVLEGLLAGLSHAEANGIVHRDLKPENLMVTTDGRVKIADFGIAKATTSMGTSAMLTATGMTVGTPTYMAPEQAMAGDIGPWTDLYSVGCIAYEMLCGRPPFVDGDTPMAIALAHIRDEPPPPRSLNDDLDPALSDWIERLLVKDPDGRTRSAVNAWDELEEIIIDAVGPRWRREARIVDHAPAQDTPRPLTPPPFESKVAPTPTPGAHPAAPKEEFQSFHLADRAADREAVDTPQPATPLPAPVVRPPQLVPEPAAVEDAVPAARDDAVAPGTPEVAAPEEPPGFATYGASARGADAAGDVVAPAVEPGPAAPPPVDTPEVAAADGSPGFETYGASARGGSPVEAPPAAEPPAPAAAAAPVDTPPPAPAARVDTPPPVAAAPASEDSVYAVTQAPSVPPAPPAAPPRAHAPSGGRGRAALTVAAAALLAVVGFLVAPRRTTTPPAPPAPVTSASAAVALAHPAGYTRGGAAPAPLTDALVLRRTVAGGTVVVAAGRAARATGPTLLPAGLRSGLDEGTPPSHVRLGRLEALRYPALRPRGSAQAMRVYAVATTAGTVDVVCAAPPAVLTGFADDCEGIATTLRLRGARGLPPRPDKAYASRVGPVLQGLGTARTAALSKMRKAKTPKGQAAAARSAETAYKRAAAGVHGLAQSPWDEGANAALENAFTGAQGAYHDLAAAASAVDRSRYRKAAGQVASAETAVGRAVDRLGRLGYAIGP
jgi:Protein kinase domain